MLNLRSNRKPNSPDHVRELRGEDLEERCLLAADIFAFQNPTHAMDVTHDSFVTPADALAIVNTLNGFELYDGKVGAYLDTSGDSIVAPNDMISIINLLNGTTESDLDAVDTEFELASEYCQDNFDDIPEGLKQVAQQFIDATADFSDSKVLLDTSLTDFLNFSLDNNAAITARYHEFEVATGVIDKEYRQDLQELSVGLTELVNANFPEDPTALDEYPDEYDFDPDAYENVEDVFDELFNEIDDVVGDIEVPDYGDVIDNFDDVFQTYDDTEFGLDEFVGGYLETDEYDLFVFEGHDVGELLDDIEGAYDAGFDLDEFVTDEFDTPEEMIDLLDGILESAYIGELIFNDVAVIGGETTGSNIVLADGSVVEVDFGDDPDLLALAEFYNNENVLIEGVAELVHGVEIPNRTVVDVTAMVGQQELASLESLLLSDSSITASTVLPYFDDILNF
jgi:hypothetical protein